MTKTLLRIYTVFKEPNSPDMFDLSSVNAFNLDKTWNFVAWCSDEFTMLIISDTQIQ